MKLKRIAAMIVALITVLSLASCFNFGGNTAETKEPEETKRKKDKETETEAPEYELDEAFYGVWYVKEGNDDREIEIGENGKLKVGDADEVKYKITADNEIAFGFEGGRFKLRFKDGELTRLESEVEDGYVYTKEKRLSNKDIAGDWAFDIEEMGDFVDAAKDVFFEAMGDDETTRAIFDHIDISVMNNGMKKYLDSIIFRFTDDGTAYFKIDPDGYRDAMKTIMTSLFEEMSWLTDEEVAEIMGVTVDVLKEGFKKSSTSWQEICEATLEQQLESIDEPSNEDIASSLNGTLDLDGLVRLSEADYAVEGNLIFFDEDTGEKSVFRYDDGVIVITEVGSDDDALKKLFEGKTLVKLPD